MAREDKRTRTLAIATLAAVLLIALAWLGRDLWLKTSREISCDDGSRRLIDSRDFTTQYWEYAVELEANLGGNDKLALKLNPEQSQQLSEAMQQGKEFRQFLVAGYNSCAIPKAQFGRYGMRFQALDSLARQIDTLASHPNPDNRQLEELIRQYVSLSQGLAEGVR